MLGASIPSPQECSPATRVPVMRGTRVAGEHSCGGFGVSGAAAVAAKGGGYTRAALLPFSAGMTCSP